MYYTQAFTYADIPGSSTDATLPNPPPPPPPMSEYPWIPWILRTSLNHPRMSTLPNPLPPVRVSVDSVDTTDICFSTSDRVIVFPKGKRHFCVEFTFYTLKVTFLLFSLLFNVLHTSFYLTSYVVCMYMCSFHKRK